MPNDMIITLSILVIAAALFMQGKIRADLIAICSLIALVLFDVLNPAEALSGFSNSVVIMMIGLFVVGGGIFETGLAKTVSGQLLRLAGTSETRLMFTVMIATIFIGAFVSNTGTVAVMLPIVVSLAMRTGISPGRLLMPLAFASSLGGTLTLIGTPPNMVIRDVLVQAGYEPLSFFSFTPIGLVCAVLGTALIIFIGKFVLPKDDFASTSKRSGSHRSLTELAQQYMLAQNLSRMQISEHSPLHSKQLADLDITHKYHIHIIEVRRRTSSKNPFFKTLRQEVAGPTTQLKKHDILYVYGAFEHASSFAADYNLMLLDHQDIEKEGETISVPDIREEEAAANPVHSTAPATLAASQATDTSSEEQAPGRMDKSTAGMKIGEFASNQTGIAEILFPPNSKYINQRIKHTDFRASYHINVLGIHRKNEYMLHELKEEKIRFGDALLVQGRWDDISRLATKLDDVVIVGRTDKAAASIPLSTKAPIAAAIMILMVISMIIDAFPAVISVLIAAVLMVATGCLRSMEQAYKTVNWESIVLIGGMIPMSVAVEKTGAAALLSQHLVGTLGHVGPIVMLGGIYFVTSALTMFVSNTACAVLLAPIALSAALQIGVSPIPFMFAVSIAASMCFAVPFSTPPNALVMAAGRYKFADYVKLGLPVQILLGIAVVAVLPLLFPF